MTFSSLAYHFIINNLEKFIGEKDDVLYLGCGRGEITNHFAGKYGKSKHFGVDIEGKYKGNLKNVEFIRGDIKEISLKRKFDVIVMSNILEHFKDPYGILERCKGWLDKNGVIIIIVPNQYGFHSTYRRGDFIRAGGHFWLYNEESLEFILKKSGFKIQSVNDGWFHFPFALRMYKNFPSLSIELSRMLSILCSRRRGNLTFVCNI